MAHSLCCAFADFVVNHSWHSTYSTVHTVLYVQYTIQSKNKTETPTPTPTVTPKIQDRRWL